MDNDQYGVYRARWLLPGSCWHCDSRRRRCTTDRSAILFISEVYIQVSEHADFIRSARRFDAGQQRMTF